MKNNSVLIFQLQFGLFLSIVALSGCASERSSVKDTQSTVEIEKAKSLQMKDQETGSSIKRELDENHDRGDFAATEKSVRSEDITDSNESSFDLPVVEKPEALGIHSSLEELADSLIEGESGESNKSEMSVKIERGDNPITSESMELISDKSDSPSNQKPWIDRESPNFSGSDGENTNDSKIEDLNDDLSKVGKTSQSNQEVNASETISQNNATAAQKSENSDNQADNSSLDLEPLRNNNKNNISQSSVQEGAPGKTVILNAANENLKSSLSTENLKKQIGLKDVFKDGTDLLPEENLSVVLSESSDQSKISNPQKTLVLSSNPQTTSNSQSGNGLNVVLGNPLDEKSSGNLVGVQNVILGNSTRAGDLTREGLQGVDVGFTAKPSSIINENRNSELKQIGFGNKKPQISSDSISTNFQTQSPNNGKRKDYLKVRKFLNGRAEVSKTNDQSDNIRNYQNVKNWVLSEAEDLNQSKPLKQSSPKQFNRASEWIRQKGRLKEDE